MHREPFSPGTILAGRYRIVNLLGRGSMGEVYRADDLKLDLPVALKFMPEALKNDEAMRARFLDEVKMARRVTHPNVCRIFDLGEIEGSLFLSMELIDGEDLASLLRRVGRLPYERASEIGEALASGLKAIHQQGILHRDLKPANLMIDGRGRARITDFGVATLAESIGHAGIAAGTPAYMAPEQLTGKNVSVRSDLYSLGLVLYELFTGRRPFVAKSIQELIQCREERPPLPSSQVQELDAPVERVIMSCLETVPGHRPASAEAVAIALAGGEASTLLKTDWVGDGLGTGLQQGHSLRYEMILRDLLAKHQGKKIVAAGDLLVFDRPAAAVGYALRFHRCLEDWSRELGAPVAGRVGIHLVDSTMRPATSVTEPLETEIVTRLALLAADHQTLMTQGAFNLARRATTDTLRSESGLKWLAHGSYLFEGMEGPIEIFEVGREGAAPLTRPSESPQARRLLSQGAIPGWRPAPGLEIPQRNNWVVVKRLGEGGMGEVWLAAQKKTRDRRVFKFCYDAQSLRSLKREITLFRLLKEELGNRTDITRILDWNFEQEPYFIESEYTTGGSLLEWAEEQGGLVQVPLSTRLEILAQIAEALAAAHSVGVLHKDVKPGNVLITTDPRGNPYAQLTDFGVGRLTDPQRLASAGITSPGTTEMVERTSQPQVGTRLYMAPELLEGKTATVQADIFALGVCLYQLVVGDFGRALAPGWRRDIEDDLLAEDIAGAVDGVPERRFGSALRLAEHLRSLDSRRSAREVELRNRKAAEQARRMAREAKAARQVADFLVDLFEVADPWGVAANKTRGNEITAREILDRGAKRVEHELRDQPEIQARLMNTIGKVYRNLGLPAVASPLIEKALDMRRQLFGNEHLDVAESLKDLAMALLSKGEYEGAESLFREALMLRRQLLSDQHIDVARALNELAILLQSKGDYNESESLNREALELRRQLLGDSHPETAESLNNLATSLHSKGELEAAERLYLEALELRRRLLGEQHPDVANSLNNLAGLLVSRGEYEGAEPLFRRALATNRRALGEEHPEVATNLLNLASLLQFKGDDQAAEPLFREALAMYRKLLGEEHPNVGYVLSNLGRSLHAQGDAETAESLHREALAIKRKQLGELHPAVAITLSSLARLLNLRSDFASSEALIRQAIEIFRQTLPERHWRRANAESVLGGCLVGLHRYGEAESLLLESYPRLKEKKGSNARYTQEALERIVALYIAWNKPQEAARYRSLQKTQAGL